MDVNDLLVLANVPWQDRALPFLVVSGLLIIGTLFAIANYRNALPFRIESSSSIAPEEVLDSLQSTFARDGWVLGYRSADSLVMSIDRNASLGSTAALGCLSVWIGLLHLVLAQKRITIEIDVAHTTGGSLIVTNGSRSGSYLKYVGWHLRELPRA